MDKNPKKLVMVLSTGRTGTRYIHDVLRYQGLLSYHEELYGNIDANEYKKTSYLVANNWKKKLFGNDNEYTDIVNDYVRNIFNIMNGKKFFHNFYSGSPNHRINKKFFYFRKYFNYPHVFSNRIVVDCNNSISPLFKNIHESCNVHQIENYFIVLFRNPIKTIHAIYMAETTSNFSERPSKFSENKNGFIAATYIWKNYYCMFLDILKKLSTKKYLLIDIETLNKDKSLILPLFQFLGVRFNENSWEDRYQKVYRNTKFRSSKDKIGPSDIVNSDLFIDKSFYFNKNEVNEIMHIINDVSEEMKIDLKKCSDEYFDFHMKQKNKIGFV